MQVNKKIFFVNQLAIEIQKWKSRLNTRRYYFQISKTLNQNNMKMITFEDLMINWISLNADFPIL